SNNTTINSNKTGVQATVSGSASGTVIVDANTISANSGNGVQLTAQDTSTVPNFTVTNNTITGNAGTGVQMTAKGDGAGGGGTTVTAATIQGNTIDTNTAGGVTLIAQDNAVVTNLQVSANASISNNGSNGVQVVTQ